MGDEEIIRRRLLFDGEGTGDERRINVLLKTFLKFCSSNETPEEMKLTHQRMLAQLVQCDLAMNKSYLCCAMNIAEQKQYEELYKEIEKGIVSTQHKIEETKMELQQARQIRRNKMEYDALAAIIQTQPDRKTNQERLAQLRSDLQASELECDKLEAKLALRRKQFHLLISSIQGLQQLLTEEEN